MADRPTGYCLEFDGNDWVDCGESAEFDLGTEMSFEVWAKIASVPDVTVFVSKDEGPGNYVPKYFWGLVPQGGDIYAMAFHVNGPGGNSGGEWVFSDPLAPEYEAWHHFAVVKIGDAYSFYFDGSHCGGGAMGYVPPPVLHPFFIGRGENYYHRGTLDEVRAWSLARSETDIAAGMFQRLSGQELALIGYWRLNEGAGQVAADASGHGNDGQLGSTPDADENDPIWLMDSPPTAVGSAPLGAAMEIACYPNPFNPATSISIRSTVRGEALLAAYDARGRRLRTLFAGWLDPGARTLRWNGRDDNGQELPSGIYLIRLQQGANTTATRLALLR